MVLGMVSYLSPKRLKVLDGRNILPIKIQDGGAAAILNLVIKRERPMATSVFQALKIASKIVEIGTEIGWNYQLSAPPQLSAPADI